MSARNFSSSDHETTKHDDREEVDDDEVEKDDVEEEEDSCSDWVGGGRGELVEVKVTEKNTKQRAATRQTSHH